MADVRDLIPERMRVVPRGIDGFWYAKFASAPTLLTDLVYVMIPDVDPDTQWGPCRWQPRVYELSTNVAEPNDPAHVGGAAEVDHDIMIGRQVLPSVGDECLVVFDNRKVPWVVMWWPT